MRYHWNIHWNYRSDFSYGEVFYSEAAADYRWNTYTKGECEFIQWVYAEVQFHKLNPSPATLLSEKYKQTIF